MTERTKLVAITHMSNVLGTVVDVKTITQAAHAIGAAGLGGWIPSGRTYAD